MNSSFRGVNNKLSGDSSESSVRKEMSIIMDLLSFESYENGDIVYESVDELTLVASKDRVSGRVTHYFIVKDEIQYEVSEATYEAIKEDKGEE